MLASALFISFDGCIDSNLAKRVREALAPVTEGLANAVTTPGAAEAGLREAWAAFIRGLGTLIQPQNPA